MFEDIRKLASVQIIQEIKPHLNSNNLQLATILGWQVVIKKEEFKINEKVIYFEIDSILPQASWSEFLRNKKFRIKTIKLRGEISQGLLMPLSILGQDINPEDFSVGQNVTENIGVTKYEDDILYIKSNTLEKKINQSAFPSDFIEKTDEPRIQSYPKYIELFKGKPYYATLKYDGTSATYLINPSSPTELLICSRNMTKEYIEDRDCVYSIVAKNYDIKNKLLSLEGKYAIQGEIYGPKINNNYLMAKSVSFVVFNAKNLIENRYLDFHELQELCDKINLNIVELIEKGESFNYNMNELKKLSEGYYPNTKNPREGLVFRYIKNWHNENRFSFKVINDEYLLHIEKSL